MHIWELGCPKKTLFLNFASAVEALVRIGVQRPQNAYWEPLKTTEHTDQMFLQPSSSPLPVLLMVQD